MLKLPGLRLATNVKTSLSQLGDTVSINITMSSVEEANLLFEAVKRELTRGQTLELNLLAHDQPSTLADLIEVLNL